MFGLQKYFGMLLNTKWYFHEGLRSHLEDLLFVEFEPQVGYFTIKKIHYTMIDVLLALEEMDFELKKINDEVKIKILNI